MSLSIIPHCDIIIKWFFQYSSSTKTKVMTKTLMMMMMMETNRKHKNKRLSRMINIDNSNKLKSSNHEKRRVNFIDANQAVIHDNMDNDHKDNDVDNDDGRDEDGYDRKQRVVDDRYDSIIIDPEVVGMTFKECSKFAHDVGLVPYIYKEMQFYG